MATTGSGQFYHELVCRNAGFITKAQQDTLSRSSVLVAGCGSTGGAVVEPLVRLGVQQLLLADNGDYEINNLNRQHATIADLGRNKAQVAADRATAINPASTVRAEAAGITAGNVDDLVLAADVVIDGVDVTQTDGWRAKLRLHKSAARFGKPVITGYDMAGMQYIRYYDYRRPGSIAFDNRITERHIDTLSTWTVLMRAIPLRYIPIEMIRNARDHIDEPEYSVPQLVYAALAFGALAARMTVEILDGKHIRRHTAIDIHNTVRRRRDSFGVALRRGHELVLASGLMLQLRQSRQPVQMRQNRR